jgi:hypothetical protein
MNEWISVKDRLPKIPEGKYGVSVLVVEFDHTFEEISPGKGSSVYETNYGYTRNKHGEKFEMYDGYDIEEDFLMMYIENGNTSWGPILDEVTHWMYLPEPPEREKI